MKNKTLLNSIYASNLTLIEKPYKDNTSKENYRSNLPRNIEAKIVNQLLPN